MDRDARLDQVLVGGRERRAIVIADYDPAWPKRFEAQRDRIARALGDQALMIEHFGSTSVPGLGAKPIVDVLVTVADLDDDKPLREALEQAGYELRVVEPGHRMFRTALKDVHVHLWADGDPEVERHLVFRDRLRASAAQREAYERLKRELAQREWNDMNEYADAKSAFIAGVIAAA